MLKVFFQYNIALIKPQICGFWAYPKRSVPLPQSSKNSLYSELLFTVLRQLNLTKNAKTVQNRDTTNLFLHMGKIRQGVMAVAAGLALTGCSEASAEDNDSPQAEIQQVAAVVETADEVKKRCRLLSHETDAQKAVKKACYAELKAMRKAEIAARTKRIDDKAIEVVEKTVVREAETARADETEARNEQHRTTIKGLSKVVALQEQEPSP